MKPQCEWIEPLLDLLAAGAEQELTEAESRAVHQHLEQCAVCREQLEAQRALLGDWGKILRNDPSPNHRVELTTRVIEQAQSAPWWQLAWERFGTRTLVPAAALIVAALIIGLISFEPTQPALQQTAQSDQPQQAAQSDELDALNALDVEQLQLVTIDELDDTQVAQLDDLLAQQISEDLDSTQIDQLSIAEAGDIQLLYDLDDEQIEMLIERLNSYTIDSTLGG
ncbi:MAG: zf-HC2 domain-containing protein [Candidatus Alcyoniella australis]|nr:zf-HC2 domain-containing protein [Candidatus Alcyoniella australis]